MSPNATATAPNPTELVVHQQSRLLEVAFDTGQRVRIPFELMRVYSPSAEVQGHGPGQEVLQCGKRLVGIDHIEAVGHYGIKPVFSDGHDSGIFTWACLLRLGTQQDKLWQDYLDRLDHAGLDRDTPMTPAARSACASTH